MWRSIVPVVVTLGLGMLMVSSGVDRLVAAVVATAVGMILLLVLNRGRRQGF